MLWSAVPSPGSAPALTLYEMGDSATEDCPISKITTQVHKSIEELVQEQTAKLASCLDKWVLHQDEVMARMSYQQQQLDETIADIRSGVKHVGSGKAGKLRRIPANQDESTVASAPHAVRPVFTGADSTHMMDGQLSNSDPRLPRVAVQQTAKSGGRSSSDNRCSRHNELASQWLGYRRNRPKNNTRALEKLAARSQKATNAPSLSVPILRDVAKSTAFDTICALALLANTALIGVETELMTYDVDQHSDVFFALQLALNCWFTVELVIRLFSEGPYIFLTGSSWRWNLFDCIILFMSIADIIISITFAASHGEEGGVRRSGGALKAIRLMRVVRSLRLVRALKTFREFRKMIYALQASMQTVCWSLLLLFCSMYCFAILFTQAASEHLHRLADEERDLEQNVAVKESYGNLVRSFYSLYLAISDGRSWGLCLDPLVEIDPFFAVLFLIFVSVTLFGVTNVITAVFVESAMSSAQYYKDLIIEDNLRSKEIAVQHMRQVFNVIDEDRSGVIDAGEFEEFLKDPALQVYLESLDISAEDTRLLFRLLDRDESGEIDIEEFCTGCLRLKGDAKSFDIHVLLSQVTKCVNMIDKIRQDLDARLNRKSAWQAEGTGGP